jgi:hypothetical protein
MRTWRFNTAFVLVLLIAGLSKSVAANLGTDNASAPAYAAGWSNGTDGGINGLGAFGQWFLNTNLPTAYTISSAAGIGNAASAVIDSAGGAFRILQTNGEASAFRFLDPAGLGVGQTFSIQLAVNFRSGYKGLDLRGVGTNDPRIFNFNIGGDDYIVNGAESGNGSVGSTYSANSVFTLSFTQTSGSGGTWSIARSGGVTSSTNGTYTGVARSIKLYNSSPGPEPEHALFVNNLAVEGWESVPIADFSSINLGQFAEHELEVPYHLWHFARVANSVLPGPAVINSVSYPPGFLDIKVNRDPADNLPHNARILEMQMVLAYFYTAQRPWNPYYGSAPVRQRLEAMLDLWTTMQAPEGHEYAGLFTEYSATNWSMAPTSFGVMAAAQAVEMIIASGQPIDAAILGNTKTAIRRALMALFTRADMRRHARQWSNQFNGAYHAALIYLERWPDAELDAAFVQAVKDSSAQDQSPAGFWYEQDGPDFGYSGVHDNNLRVAWPRLRQRTDLVGHIISDDIQWNEWLAANTVLQPGLATNTFFTSAGLNTRTSHAFQTPRSRPLSEFATNSRAFALTLAEFAAAVEAKRGNEQPRFGNYGTLSVPSAYSYMPGFVYDAARPPDSTLDSWHPDAAQRDAAIAALPSRATNSFSRLFHNAAPASGAFSLAATKRPGYYATFASGQRRMPRQAYGLNLLWNSSFGLALQSVAGSSTGVPWQWGTAPGSAASPAYETGNMPGTIKIGTNPVSPVAGVTEFPTGDYSVDYALASGGVTYGNKSVTLGSSDVNVVVTHAGVFTEYLPLAYASDATISNGLTRLVLQRPDGSSFLLQLNSPASIDPGSTSSLTTGMVRRGVTIRATNTLSYTLAVSDIPPPPETGPPGAADPFVLWREQILWQGADSSPEADPDRDGFSNLAEYALGTDPLSAFNRPAAVVTSSGEPARLAITFHRTADPSLVYEVLASNDLSAWGPVWRSSGADNVAGPVTVHDPEHAGVRPSRFMRLRLLR